MLVAHAYNASYSEGRDQEDHGSKPAQTKKGWLKVLALSSNPSTVNNNKKDDDNN
jgi:hypothetical protein